MEKGHRVRHKEKDTGFKGQVSEMEKVEKGEGKREPSTKSRLIHRESSIQGQVNRTHRRICH